MTGYTFDTEHMKRTPTQQFYFEQRFTVHNIQKYFNVQNIIRNLTKTNSH